MGSVRGCGRTAVEVFQHFAVHYDHQGALINPDVDARLLPTQLQQYPRLGPRHPLLPEVPLVISVHSQNWEPVS